jgi:hypothetical protein
MLAYEGLQDHSRPEDQVACAGELVEDLPVELNQVLLEGFEILLGHQLPRVRVIDLCPFFREIFREVNPLILTGCYLGFTLNYRFALALLFVVRELLLDDFLAFEGLVLLFDFDQGCFEESHKLLKADGNKNKSLGYC